MTLEPVGVNLRQEVGADVSGHEERVGDDFTQERNVVGHTWRSGGGEEEERSGGGGEEEERSGGGGVEEEKRGGEEEEWMWRGMEEVRSGGRGVEEKSEVRRRGVDGERQ